jgi:hypothetical protein
MLLCLFTHQHINVRSEKYIILASFAAYYMKGESNKEVIKVKASAAKVNAE